MLKAPAPEKIECEDPPDEVLMASGVYGLWLTVTLLSVQHFLKYRTHSSKEFIFDEENFFFDFVMDELGLDPELARRRISRQIKKDHNAGDPPMRGIKGKIAAHARKWYGK